MPSIYSITDYLDKTTYQGETVINVFKKIKLPDTFYQVNSYEEYIIKAGDRWDSLSTKFYGNPNLWWLIATYNKVTDPFAILTVGDTINILNVSIVSNVLLNIKGYIE